MTSEDVFSPFGILKKVLPQYSYRSGQEEMAKKVETAFNEGRKYIGTLIFAQLQEICPELYLRMVKENTDHKEPETKLED